MTSKTVALLLADLGVTRSHSCPRVSNDNPYSGAHFRTMKYRPDFPASFENLQAARAWGRQFFDYYNNQHRNSGIGLLTPAVVHHGQDAAIRKVRAAVLDANRLVKRAQGAAPLPGTPTAWTTSPPLTRLTQGIRSPHKAVDRARTNHPPADLLIHLLSTSWTERPVRAYRLGSNSSTLYVVATRIVRNKICSGQANHPLRPAPRGIGRRRSCRRSTHSNPLLTKNSPFCPCGKVGRHARGTMRVAIAEDSGVIRKAVELLLRSIGSEAVISVSTGQELLAAIETDLSGNPPDVAIVDMRMPPTRTDEGLRTALLLKEAHPATGVLVVTAHADDPFGADLIATGMAGVGYMRKDNIADGHHLKDALDRLAAGELVVDSSITASLLRREFPNNRLDALSEREREILGLMAQGRSNAGIARLVHLSPKTVEARIASIFLKLGLRSDQTYNRRVLAVLEWLRMGNVMVDPGHQ